MKNRTLLQKIHILALAVSLLAMLIQLPDIDMARDILSVVYFSILMALQTILMVAVVIVPKWVYQDLKSSERSSIFYAIVHAVGFVLAVYLWWDFIFGW